MNVHHLDPIRWTWTLFIVHWRSQLGLCSENLSAVSMRSNPKSDFFFLLGFSFSFFGHFPARTELPKDSVYQWNQAEGVLQQIQSVDDTQLWKSMEWLCFHCDERVPSFLLTVFQEVKWADFFILQHQFYSIIMRTNVHHGTALTRLPSGTECFHMTFFFFCDK